MSLSFEVGWPVIGSVRQTARLVLASAPQHAAALQPALLHGRQAGCTPLRCARCAVPAVLRREVEDFLHTHPAVADVQVFGVPSKLYGEEVCAWVKLRCGRRLPGAACRRRCMPWHAAVCACCRRHPHMPTGCQLWPG